MGLPSAVAFEHIREVMRPLFVHVAMCWLRTVSNGGFTSVRMNEVEDLGCLMGCTDVSDCLQHYMSCPRLWLVARRATEMRPHAHFSDNISRLGLNPDVSVSTSRTAVRILALACMTCHSVKLTPDLQCKTIHLRDP